MNELTLREQEVHELLILGCTRQEIALELSISVQTIKNHAHKIYVKTNTADQLDLILNHYELPTWKRH